MKKSNILSVLMSLVFTFSLFAFVNAETNTVNVKSNNFLNNYIQKTPPYTYLPLEANNNTATTTSTGLCIATVTKYNKLGDFGPEVVKLQNFLNQVNGAKLNGLGYFGPVTLQEVKNFQYTYGINPTGYQYVKTTQKMNDILCGKVAKVNRKVYSMPNSISASVMKPMSPNMLNSIDLNKIQKNETNVVKEYASKTIPAMTGNPNDKKLMATNTTATRTSFWANLENDFNKIKENYKAYLLVFALVLALFWFLRKAATE